MKAILTFFRVLLLNPFTLMISGIVLLFITLEWKAALGIILLIYGQTTMLEWWVKDKFKTRMEKDGPISKN